MTEEGAYSAILLKIQDGEEQLPVTQMILSKLNKWTDSTPGTNHPKSSLVGKALEELNTSQQRALAANVNSILGCIRRSVTRSLREVDRKSVV